MGSPPFSFSVTTKSPLFLRPKGGRLCLSLSRHGSLLRQLGPNVIIKAFYPLFLIVSYKVSISFHLKVSRPRGNPYFKD